MGMMVGGEWHTGDRVVDENGCFVRSEAPFWWSIL
jgi:hypothetical protein